MYLSDKYMIISLEWKVKIVQGFLSKCKRIKKKIVKDGKKNPLTSDKRSEGSKTREVKNYSFSAFVSSAARSGASA